MRRTAPLTLCFLLAACGAGTDLPDPGPTPTPGARTTTRLEVLRDAAGARLSLTVNGTGGPAFLYGQRVTLYFGGGETQIASIDPASCTVRRHWESIEAYLDAAEAHGLSLLHLELWNVWEPRSPFPFLQDSQGRYRVQAAVEQGVWNEQYFRTLRALFDGASERGMVVLLSLFNHYNIRISDGRLGGRPWTAEPLRAANTDTLFGLGEHGGDWKLRTAEFLRFSDASGGLTTMGRIQKALVERVLDEVHQQNVLLEPLMVPWLFNNQHVGALDLPRWSSWLIAVVRERERALGRGVRSTIEITPAPLSSDGAGGGGSVYQDFDAVHWREAHRTGRAGFESWAEVDVVGYAGGLAYGMPPFGAESVAYVRERWRAHRGQFPDKALLYSTDGFNQRYAPSRCTAALGSYVQDVRHGWWDEPSSGVDLSQYPLSWAQQARDQAAAAGAPLGAAHFLNWTTALSSMEDLGRGGL
jgi:hypothetical protein